MTNNNLRTGEVLSFPVVEGEVISSESGLFWLTIEGRQEDVLLKAGQSWAASVKGKVVVQAMREGVLARRNGANLSPSKARWSGLQAWLRGGWSSSSLRARHN